MKHFWHACFAVIASTAMIGTANAQWNQSPEIGSYQSILARTGYGGSPVGGTVGSVPGALPSAMQSGSGTRNVMPGQLGSSVRDMAPFQNVMPSQQGSGTHNMAPMQNVMPSQQGSGTHNMAPMQNAMPVQQGSGTRNMAPPSVNSGTSYITPQASAGCIGCGTSGGGSYGGPTMAPAMGDVYVDSGSSSCGSGNCGGSSMVGSGVGNYTDFGAGSCGDPVYTPGASVGGGIGSNVPNTKAGGGVNRVGGVFGVLLRRNYEDPLRIGGLTDGRAVFSDDIRNGDVSGVGASLASRKANGNGSELVYWGLSDETRSTFDNPDFFSIGQFEDLNLDGNTVFQTYNNATSISVFRDFDINNFEANLLRNGGNYTTRNGKSGNFELLGGFRLFQFDESLRIIGNGTTSLGRPGSTEYRSEADNFLLGGQMGARNEICLSKRLRFTSGVNVGVFNNRSETRQQIFDQDGVKATIASGPNAGEDFYFEDTQDDVAILGELKVGLAYQLTDSWRYHVGYQVLGVGGLALAADQVPLNATDAGLLSRSRTNQSLLLQGLYFGGQKCF